jgi:hypothetical protein
MFDEPANKEMIPATYENKQRLRVWLAGVKPNGGTDPREALQHGMNILPDAIFLLSDGEFSKFTPNQGWLDKQRASATEIVEQHHLSATPVHTVAYEDRKNRRTLELISNKTGGEHSYLPPQAMTIMDNLALYEQNGQWAEALDVCNQVIKDYPGTPEATEAAAALPRIKESLQLAKLTLRNRQRLIARTALAQQFASAGKTARALNLYRTIAQEHAGTEYAENAQQQIEALSKAEAIEQEQLDLLMGKP